MTKKKPYKEKLKNRAKYLNTTLMLCKASTHDDKAGIHQKRSRLEQAHRRLMQGIRGQ